MVKFIFIFLIVINVYADSNTTFEKFELRINKVEQENVLLKNENSKLISKVNAIDSQNKYIETTYTTIIDGNQNRLDNFLWILASVIALLGFFGFLTIKRFTDEKINKIIKEKEDEFNLLINEVEDLKKGLEFEYLQKLAEFSQHNKKKGETKEEEKKWITYYAELLPKNEDDRSSEDWYIFALKYFYADNNMEESIKCTEKSIQTSNTFDYEPNKLLVYSYKALGEYEKAIKQCLKILQEIEDDEIYYELAENYMYLEDWISAIEVYLKIESNSSDYPVYFQIAQAYSNIGNYEKTIEYLNKDLNINENNTNIFYGLANSYNELNNKEESIKYIQKALDIEPENIEFQEFLYFLKKNKL